MHSEFRNGERCNDTNKCDCGSRMVGGRAAGGGFMLLCTNEECEFYTEIKCVNRYHTTHGSHEEVNADCCYIGEPAYV